MLVRLVRHGRAGHKKEWDGDDSLRPLDALGERNAAALARLLADQPPGRLLSSPTRRCVQTLEPLAAVWDVKVDQDAGLGPDAGALSALALLGRADEGDVLCTHGEVMSALLERLRADGTEIVNGTRRRSLLTKGTMWELDLEGGHVRRLRHVDPVAEGARAR